MAGQEDHLRITAVLDQVPAACRFVALAAARAGLDDRAVYHCELAADEVITNIIEHGYKLSGQNQIVDILCRTTEHRFVIVISDDSPAFNPLRQPAPDPTAPLEQRTGGGWGIHFIRQMMDEVSYAYMGQRNYLTMAKRLRQHET